MKILIADPHTEVQSALRLILNRIPEVTAAGEANTLVQLLAQCTQSCPDLILFDLGLLTASRSRSQTLSDLLSVVHHLCPYSQVLVMSSQFEAEPEALASGASGFISKTDPPDIVLSTIVRFLKAR